MQELQTFSQTKWTEKTNVSEGKGCMATDSDAGDEGSLKSSLKHPYFNKPQTPKEMDQS